MSSRQSLPIGRLIESLVVSLIPSNQLHVFYSRVLYSTTHDKYGQDFTLGLFQCSGNL